MSGPVGSSTWFGEPGYNLNQSLRFNDADAPFLSKTFASAGNRKTWTYSVWIKRGADDTSLGGINHTLLSTSSGDGLHIRAGSNNDVFQFQYGTDKEFITTAEFRDYSAWYHIIFVYDSTNGTAADRAKLYVNGVRVTAFASASYPNQNVDGHINNNVAHQIGRQNDLARYFDGYLAEVNFIDGLAKAPADFGETGDYGEWIPIQYAGAYGTNGFYLNFAGGGIMSATGGNSTATDGDFKAASFTASGTFTPSADGFVEYLVVAGGGNGAGFGASSVSGGGGGAGGYRTGMLAVTGGTGYSITVGGAAQNSVFSSITSIAGGNGGAPTPTVGGSGGGSGAASPAGAAGTAGQGNAGGTGTGNWGYTTTRSGGGGGSSAVGANSDGTSGGAGGAGTASSITGSSVTYAAGGEGVAHTRNTAGTPGAANTGNGGGGTGGSGGNSGGAGGSGIVIIRYKFQ